MYDEQFKDVIKHLETNPIDQYLKIVSIQAKELECVLNDNSISGSEYDQLIMRDLEKETIDKLNSECPHIGELVVVSGSVVSAYYDEFEEKYSTTTVLMESEVVRSMGYSTLLMNEGEPDEKVVVGHVFFIKSDAPVRTNEGLVEYVPRLYGFAPVGMVDIQYELADVKKIELLQNTVPEMLSQINSLIADTENECDALKNLGDMTMSSYLDVPNETLRHLNIYTFDRLDFDTEVPYQVAIQGIIYNENKNSQDSDGYSYEYFSDDAEAIVAFPIALDFMQHPSIRNKGVHIEGDTHWHVTLRVMTNNHKEKSKDFIVPVRSIKEMYSIRRLING